MANDLDRLKTALADRYAIEIELGRGGMAVVYLAEDLKHRRPVAVKVFNPELAAQVGAERFLREIRISAKLNHPHILPLLDSGDADGFLYYVMPFVEGESLCHRLAHEGTLPLEDALRIAREVAGALDYAHRHGVVHRDIKPANILLHEGVAMVADFGVARAVRAAGGTQLTQVGKAIGTPRYMSPEQAYGSEDLDGRTDTYSLGCVLYEMLVGEPPAMFIHAVTQVQTRVSNPSPEHRRQLETVPDVVERALAKSLAKHPRDRFSTISKFAQALSGPGVAGVRAKWRGGGVALLGDLVRSPPFGSRGALTLGAAVVAVLAVALTVWRIVPGSDAAGLVDTASAGTAASLTAALPDSGWLVVNGAPRGARYIIDDTPSSSNRIRLETGTYRLEVRAANYRDYEGPINLARGDTLIVTVDLERLAPTRPAQTARAQCDGPTQENYNLDHACFDRLPQLLTDPSLPIPKGAQVGPNPSPVIVWVQVGTDGRSSRTWARASSDPSFITTLALRYAMSQNYRPAVKAGRPVEAWFQVRLVVRAANHRDYERPIYMARGDSQIVTVNPERLARTRPTQPVRTTIVDKPSDTAAAPPARPSRTRARAQCDGPTQENYNLDSACFDRLPQLMGSPSVPIPDGARVGPTPSPVTVWIQVGVDGRAKSRTVAEASSDPGFTILALRYAMSQNYRPAVKAGRPVDAWFQVRFFPGQR